jgi:acyl-CoA thioester hydrolase
MPAVFEYCHTVHDDEIDVQGHVNNVCYVQWLQDAAVAHSAAQGWPTAAYLRLGCGWVVRSHTIEYHRPAQAGQAIVVQTWVATFKRVTSLRRYRVLRVADGALLATAETKWAFVNYATGQPIRVPEEIVQAFVIVEHGPPSGQGTSQTTGPAATG